MIPLYNPTDFKSLATTSSTTIIDPRVNNFKLLAGADSMHDFNLNGNRVPIDTWPNVSFTLLQNLYGLVGTPQMPSLDKANLSKFDPGDKFTAWTQSMSINKITASSVEEQTVSYFETEYKNNLLGKTKILTYTAVVDTIKKYTNEGDPINTAIWKANKMLCENADILEIDISIDEGWDKSYSTQDKIYIGLFLLNFYFPPTDIDPAFNTKNPTYITFDAGSNIPSKIFGLLDQVINLVTPLNIADSATEGQHLAVDKSQKRAGVKNKYVFPLNEISTGPGYYLYKSNVFTMSNNVRLFIKKPDDDYTERNKYNFVVEVDQGLASCNLINFTNGDVTYSSGPGVKYLSNVMAGSSDNPIKTGVAPIKTDCGIPSLPNNKPNALYFDVKRSGDWEQCLAALTVNKTKPETPQTGRVILCTLDRLCALFSRCLGQNTLYHYGTKLVLFRYSTAVLTREQIEQQQLSQQQETAKDNEKARESIEKINKAFDELDKRLNNTNNTNNIVLIKGFASNTELKRFINQLAKLLLLASLAKYKSIYDTFIKTTDANQFLISLRELTGEYVTYNRIDNFIDIINNFKKSILINGSLITLPKGSFCYYNSNLLINNIYKDLLDIFNFDSKTNRVTKTLSNNNYKIKLDDSGLFNNLNKISNELNIINTNSNTQLFKFLEKEFSEIPYDKDLIVSNIYTESNKKYYTQLQTSLKNVIKTMFQTTSQGGRGITRENNIIQRGGVTQQEKDNLVENLLSNITTEFISLSVSLNEMTEKIVKVDTSFDDFITQIMNNKDEKYTNDILQLLQVFFENSWSYIQQAEASIFSSSSETTQRIQVDQRQFKQGIDINKVRQSKIETRQEKLRQDRDMFINENRKMVGGSAETELFNIKRLYYMLYLFFACLYGEIPKEQDAKINEIIAIGFSNRAEINDYINNVFLTNNFFNDYIDKTPPTGIIYNSDIKATNLIIIIKYCLNIRTNYSANINNYVLFIFTFFVNYLKFYVKKVAEKNKVADLSTYGYYKGIITNFTDNQKIQELFTKINDQNKKNNPNNTDISIINNDKQLDTEITNYEQVFLQIDIIIKALLMYTIDPISTIKHLKETSSLGGGKYTQKKSTKQMKSMKQRKIMKQRKTMKQRKQRKTLKNIPLKK
jgi:hypothetical protein